MSKSADSKKRIGKDELEMLLSAPEAIKSLNPDDFLEYAPTMPEVREYVKLMKRGLHDGRKWAKNAADDGFIQVIEILNSERDIFEKIMGMYFSEDAICDSFGTECFTENNGLYNITTEAKFYALGWAKAVLTTTRKPAPKKTVHRPNLLSKEKFLEVLNKHAPKKVEWTPELGECLEYINHAKRGEFDGKEWAKKVSPEKLAKAAAISDFDGNIPQNLMAWYANDLFGDEVLDAFAENAFFMEHEGDIVPTPAAKAYAYGWTVAIHNTHLEALAKDTSPEK